MGHRAESATQQLPRSLPRACGERSDLHGRPDRPRPGVGQAGGVTSPVQRWDGPGEDAWQAWDPWEAASRLSGSGARWWVVAGWAIDLALGRRTRPHSDLEIAVIDPDVHAVRRHLGDYVFHSVGDGSVIRLGAEEERHADHFQHWVLDPGVDRWRIDVMVDPGDE